MGILHETAYSLRLLRKDRWFTLTALLSLAIGIGASTTIFTLVEALLLRPLPGIEKQQSLINVQVREAGDAAFQDVSWATLRDIQRMDRVTGGLAAYSGRAFSLTRGGEPQLVAGQIVSGNYFALLGVRPVAGRFFTAAEDDAHGAQPLAVISFRLWQRRFGGDPRLVGSKIVLNGIPLTVAGIAPKGFGGTFFGFVSDVFVPQGMARQLLQRNDLGERKTKWLEVIGRLRPGTSVAQAQAGLGTILRRLAQEFPDQRNLELVVSPVTGYDPELRGGVIAFLSILMVVSLLVLLIASINVASMVLARGVARGKELAIRLALGLRRERLIGQLLIESMVLAVLGGSAGVLAANWGVALLHRLEPPVGIPLVFDFNLDTGVLAFAFAVSVASGLAVGLLPALQASRPDLVATLKEAVSQTADKALLRSLLVVGQVAVSALLLLTAGLFLRALQHAGAVAPGFDSHGVEVVTLDPSVLGFDAARSRDFFLHLEERLGALPGVEAVGLGDKTPLGLGSLFGGQTTSIQVAGHQPPPGADGLKVEFNLIGPRFLDVLRIPLLRGRDFTAADRADAPQASIVNEAMASHFWPRDNPIGKRFLHEGRPVEVVGLARNSKYVRLAERPRDHLYLAFAQRPRSQMTLFLRAAGAPSSLVTAVREEIRRAAPSLPILQLMSMNESIAISRLPQRVAATVAGLLGLTGLLLAAVGIYGVVAYSVSQRRRELGIRMALGARRQDVLRLIVRQGLVLALVGIGLGTLGALALGRVLTGLLFGVSPSDPPTYVGIALILLAAAGVASLVPAYRASRTDPLVTFRAG